MTERKAKTGDLVVYKTLTYSVVSHIYDTCACFVGEPCSESSEDRIDAVELENPKKYIGWVREELVSVLPESG